MKATTRVTIYGAFLIVLLGSALGQHIQTNFDHHAKLLSIQDLFVAGNQTG
jgi:hypothetical protein